MNRNVFSNISKIIERDSKNTTYKFALLRGTIDIIQENSPYIIENKGRVEMPIGLLIVKWLIYYYPILQSKIYIPQINGNKNLAFQNDFKTLIYYYENKGGFSTFYNDLKNKGIPEEIKDDFFRLTKKIRKTITENPMQHIGRSVYHYSYSIYNYENNKRLINSSAIDIEILINDFGSFSIPIEYYEAFKLLGSFINGQDSILFQWAEFSVNASGKKLTVEKVINEILETPVQERDAGESRRIIENKESIYCVWTGKKISKYNYDVDHIIPFSIWKNNDLWNLLPCNSIINRKEKKDKIPSPDLIEKQKDIILNYWNIIYREESERFRKEFQTALLGNQSFKNWQQNGISQLKENCNYLIENRGFEEWKI